MIGTSPSATQLHDALVGGLDTLSARQTVTFVPYVRTILPVDGFVVWVSAGLLTPQRVLAAGLSSPVPVQVDGSLHYSSQLEQTDGANFSVTQVVFNTDTAVEAFSQVNPQVVYIATVRAANGTHIRFSFSRHDNFYEEAGVYHYFAYAIYSTLATVLVDTLDGFDQRPVLSNSVPIWWSMFNSDVPFPSLVGPPAGFRLYPAQLAPTNYAPPFGTVTIEEESQESWQLLPSIDRTYGQTQLVRERATLTLWGLRNDEAQDLVQYVIDYTTNTDGTIGLCRPPVLRDIRHPQVELTALAMGKRVTFDVNYHQHRARDVARQLILQAGFAVPPSAPVAAAPPAPWASA